MTTEAVDHFKVVGKTPIGKTNGKIIDCDFCGHRQTVMVVKLHHRTTPYACEGCGEIIHDPGYVKKGDRMTAETEREEKPSTAEKIHNAWESGDMGPVVTLPLENFVQELDAEPQEVKGSKYEEWIASVELRLHLFLTGYGKAAAIADIRDEARELLNSDTGQATRSALQQKIFGR